MRLRIRFPADWLAASIEVRDEIVLEPENRVAHDFLRGFRTLLHQNIGNGRLKVQDTAGLVQMTPKTLGRRLASLGTSASEEIAAAQMAYAKTALATTSRTIEDIASSLDRQAHQPAAASELFPLACVACSPFSVLRFLNITSDQFRWGIPPQRQGHRLCRRQGGQAGWHRQTHRQETHSRRWKFRRRLPDDGIRDLGPNAFHGHDRPSHRCRTRVCLRP